MIFSGLKHEFEFATVSESSVFESLRFCCRFKESVIIYYDTDLQYLQKYLFWFPGLKEIMVHIISG